jgi:hypothetical protein
MGDVSEMVLLASGTGNGDPFKDRKNIQHKPYFKCYRENSLKSITRSFQGKKETLHIHSASI